MTKACGFLLFNYLWADSLEVNAIKILTYIVAGFIPVLDNLHELLPDSMFEGLSPDDQDELLWHWFFIGRYIKMALLAGMFALVTSPVIGIGQRSVFRLGLLVTIDSLVDLAQLLIDGDKTSGHGLTVCYASIYVFLIIVDVTGEQMGKKKLK